MIGQRRDRAVARARAVRRTAAALIALSAVWIAVMLISAFRWFGYVGDGWLADVGDGTLYTMTWSTATDDYSLRGWHSAPNTQRGGTSPGTWTWWQWGVAGEHQIGPRGSLISYGHSIWPAGLAPSVAGTCILFALHRDRARRVRQNLCMNCGYPRKDLPPATACPECGHNH